VAVAAAAVAADQSARVVAVAAAAVAAVVGAVADLSARVVGHEADAAVSRKAVEGSALSFPAGRYCDTWFAASAR
jgi:hypothetical protein